MAATAPPGDFGSAPPLESSAAHGPATPAYNAYGFRVDSLSSWTMRPFSCTLLVVLAATVALPAEDDLPPPGCVRLLREARVAEMADQSELALAKLRQAVEAYPEEVVPIVALVDYHRKHEAPPEEVAMLREVLTKRLADSERPVPAATLEYLVSNPDAGPDEMELVLAAVESRLAAFPDDDKLLRAASLLQQRLDHKEDAHRTLRRMLEIRPTKETVWRCLVLDHELELWDEVADHLGELVKQDPAASYLRMTYIEALGKTARYEELVRQLDHINSELNIYDTTAKHSLRDLLLQVAWDLRDAGHTDKGEQIFRRILALDPQDKSARQAILYLYSTAEEREAHEAELRKRWALESNPDALLAEGANLLASGSSADAFPLLERAAQGLPDSELANFNLGLAAIKLERWKVAEHAMGRAIELNPSRAESYLNRGIALQYLDRCQEAIEVLERALDLQDDLLQSHYYLYECHRRLGNEAEAAEHRELYNASVQQP